MTGSVPHRRPWRRAVALAAALAVLLPSLVVYLPRAAAYGGGHHGSPAMAQAADLPCHPAPAGKHSHGSADCPVCTSLQMLGAALSPAAAPLPLPIAWAARCPTFAPLATVRATTVTPPATGPPAFL